MTLAGLTLDVLALPEAPDIDLTDLIALTEARERWPAGTPGGLGGQFKPGYHADQFVGSVTPKKVGEMTVGDHFVSPKGKLYKLVQKSDKTEWAKAINLDTGKPYPVKQHQQFSPVPHEAIEVPGQVPDAPASAPEAEPEAPKWPPVDVAKAGQISLKLTGDKLINEGPTGKPRNVSAMSSEKLVATVMHPSATSLLKQRCIDELHARGLNANGQLIAPTDAQKAKDLAAKVQTAVPTDAPPDDLALDTSWDAGHGFSIHRSAVGGKYFVRKDDAIIGSADGYLNMKAALGTVSYYRKHPEELPASKSKAPEVQPLTPPEPIDATPEPLDDAVGHGGLAAYGSAWGPGGKFKYDPISQLGTGQVFLDKKGKAWKVKLAGSNPVVSDGEKHYVVDGSLKVKAAEHAKTPVVFTDNAGKAPKVDQTGQAPAEPEGIEGKLMTLPKGGKVEVEGYTIQRGVQTGDYRVSKDGKALTVGGGEAVYTTWQGALQGVHHLKAEAAKRAPQAGAHPSQVEMTAPAGWKASGGPAGWTGIGVGDAFHINGTGFIKTSAVDAKPLGNATGEGIVPVTQLPTGPVVPMVPDLEPKTAPVKGPPAKGAIKGAQSLPAGKPLAVKSLELAVGDVVQLKKGGWKYTLVEPYGLNGGWKAQASNGSTKILGGYKTISESGSVKKADGSKLKLADWAASAPAAPAPAKVLTAAQIKAKLTSPGPKPIGDLPDGSVIGTPDGKVLVLKPSEGKPKYGDKQYVVAYDLQSGLKVEPPTAPKPTSYSNDPEVVAAAAATLKKAQTPTETTVATASGATKKVASTGPPPRFANVPTDAAAEKIMKALMGGKQKLTPDEKAAVKRYTGSGYTEINSALRKSTGIKSLDLAKRVKAIDSAIAKQPEFEQSVVLSRKTNVDTWLNADAGDVIQDNAFLSTSTWGGTWSGQVQLRILCPPGTKGLWVNDSGASSHPGEKEVMLPRGTQFHVLKREKYSGATVLYVEVIA